MAGRRARGRTCRPEVCGVIDPGINIPRSECVFGIVCGASELARIDHLGCFDELEVVWLRDGRKVSQTRFFCGFERPGDAPCQ